MGRLIEKPLCQHHLPAAGAVHDAEQGGIRHMPEGTSSDHQQLQQLKLQQLMQ